VVKSQVRVPVEDEDAPDQADEVSTDVYSELPFIKNVAIVGSLRSEDRDH